MAVCKVKKTDNYTVMSNEHLRDKNLSLKAIGLLSKIMSLPPDWNYSINGLVAICKESKKAVISALDELKNEGYLKINKLYPNDTKSGRFEYEYVFYEQKQEPPFQDLEKQDLEKQELEKEPQLNKEQLNKEHQEWTGVEDIDTAFDEFLKMRKKLKKPATDRAVELLLGKLLELSDANGITNADTAVDIINQSIINGWAGLFPLKNPKKIDWSNI